MIVKKNRLGGASPIVCGLWLATMFTVVMLNAVFHPVKNLAAVGQATDTLSGTVALLVAVVWPAVYLFFISGRQPAIRMRWSSGIALACFLLFCLCSIAVSPGPAMSAAYLLLTVVTVWVCYRFARDFYASPEQMAVAFRLYAPLVTLQLVLFSYLEYVPGYRLGEGKGMMEPASIGLNALSGVLASMAYRSNLVRLPLIAILLVIIYLTESRAPALAVLLGLAVVFFGRLKHQHAGRKLAGILLVMLGCGLALVFHEVWLPHAERFLALNDEHRGLAAGGSGRLLIWRETWQVFLDHPLFGVGYRMHEGFLRIGTSSHNGYLSLLAEIGIFGFMAAMFLILGGLMRSALAMGMNAESTRVQSILLAFIVSGLFVGIFERFLVNTGNAFSVVFLLAVLWHVLERRRPA